MVFKEAQTFFDDPEKYYRVCLEKIEFKDIEITLIESLHPLTDQEFISYTQQWCGCYPWLQDESLREDFIKDILKNLSTFEHQVDEKLPMQQESIRIFARR